VLFFNNVVGKEAMLDKVISDVNTTFGRGVRINTEGKPGPKEVSVIGWNNFIKANTIIGSGCTVYPSLPSEKIPKQVEPGEVIR
jgi:glucose-1-phosphate adenylyltransferase